MVAERSRTSYVMERKSQGVFAISEKARMMPNILLEVDYDMTISRPTQLRPVFGPESRFCCGTG